MPSFCQVSRNFMVFIRYFSRSLAFLLCLERHRRPVLVGAGYHQDLIALLAMITGKDVRRQISPCYMPQVQLPFAYGQATPINIRSLI